MLSENVRQFLAENHNAVLTTYRRNGSAQMSIVTCGLYGDGVAFTVSGVPAKLANLRRDPRCSILVSQPDWWGYVVLQGTARLYSPGVTEPDKLRQVLRDVYQAASGQPHPDWDDYDRAVAADSRSAILVVPETEFMQIL